MLDRIRAALPALPRSEQRVAKLVLADPRRFARLTIGEMADRAHVSKPTIVRFCRSMGYHGLVDFRRKLQGSVPEGTPFVHRSVDAGDAAGDVLKKVVDGAVATLLDHRDRACVRSLELAATAVMQAHAARRLVQFHGAGNSGLVAQDAQHKFFRFGIHAAAYHDGPTQLMAATLLAPGDVACFISNSGRNRDVLEACELARSKGATTIAITAEGSPLAAASGILLAAEHQENCESFSPMASRLLHLMIVDVLATTVALRIGAGSVQPALREMKAQLRARSHV